MIYKYCFSSTSFIVISHLYNPLAYDHHQDFLIHSCFSSQKHLCTGRHTSGPGHASHPLCVFRVTILVQLSLLHSLESVSQLTGIM